MEQNFTPLNSSMGIPDFQQSPGTPPTPPKKKIGFSDIYLISSVLVFVVSLGVMINSRNFATTSDAKAMQDVTVVPRNQTVSKLFPKSYKQEKIPTTIYENLNTFPSVPKQGQDEYVKTQVMKFYVYKDVLQENTESTKEALIPTTYKDIHEGVLAMEPIIKNNLLSKAFFSYIQAKFTGPAGSDSDIKAKAVMKRYQQLFVAGDYTATQIVDISNKDEELLTLNNREKNQFIDDYDPTQVLFADTEFNDFLFSQQENQLSDVYTLLDTNKNPQGYVIVYPSKIIIKKYATLEKLIEEREQNFTF